MKLFSLIAALMVAGSAFANQTDASNDMMPQKVYVPIAHAYIPGGFDSNDRAQIVIEGAFSNSCYKMGPYESTLDPISGKLTIRQTAYKYNGHCLAMMIPFNQTINLGVLSPRSYTVVDGTTSATIGTLPVKASISVDSDDYVYLNVIDAYLHHGQDNTHKLYLQGVLPSACWKVKETKVFPDGKDVIVALPILEMDTTIPCGEYAVPYTVVVDSPAGLSAGRYLLHVRSLSGNSVNKLIDID